MRRFRSTKLNSIRAGVVVLALSILSGGIFYARFSPRIFAAGGTETAATPRKKAKPPARATRYSAFPHNKHKSSCDSCHKFPSANWKTVRKTDAFPDITEYPRHESCLSCHRPQFFKGGNPAICSICHTNPSPRGGPRHPFPNPREIFDASPKGKTAAASDFRIAFPHDKHIDIVSRHTPETPKTVRGTMFVSARLDVTTDESAASCAVCHQTDKPQNDSDDEYLTKPPAKPGDAFWLKKGTFKTVPTGHATCFTCHSADTGILPAPTGCATCHKLAAPDPKTDFDAKTAAPMKIDDKITLAAWRRRDSSATFRHEWFSHAELACTVCHNAAGMNTTDALSKKVRVLSCGGDGTGCHITPTADDGGALNYEIEARRKDAGFGCVKCHLAYGRAAIPESHTRAVSTFAPK